MGGTDFVKMLKGILHIYLVSFSLKGKVTEMTKIPKAYSSTTAAVTQTSPLDLVMKTG